MIGLLFTIECHPTCPHTCKWQSCCLQIGCDESCGHTYAYCSPEIISAKIIRCPFQVNGNGSLPSKTINVTFESSIDCTNCNSECSCASASVGLVPVSCLVSTYSVHMITGSLSGITTPVSSVMATHLTAYNTTTPSTSVPVTSTIIIVLAVVGTALLLCLMVAAVFGSSLALVLCRAKRNQFPVTNNSDPMSQQRYTS